MRSEHAEVLVIGAGAGGAVAALRLAEAGVRVVCLEQGDWHDRADYPGTDPTWELQAGGRWSPSPNVRQAAGDYPLDTSGSDMGALNFNGVGGGTVLYNAQWPRMLPADFRVRSVDGVADDWPLDYAELQPSYDEIDRQFGVSGLGGNPAYPPGVDPPLPPLPVGEIGLRLARAHHRLGWHWWPATNAITSAPYEGRHVCVRRGTCGIGCNEGAKGSTDVTHWPRFLALGGRLITGARVRRIVLGPDGRAAGADWVDRDGSEHHQSADVVLCAANAIGTARLLLASADARHPDGMANGSGLVGRRLMLHPLSTVAGVFDEPLQGWRAQNGALIQSLQFAASDPSRGFLRGSTWGLGSSGGTLRAALGRDGRGVWGDEHHANLVSRLGRRAQWAVLCEDLPESTNRVELDLGHPDADGIPGVSVHYQFSENSRRSMAFSAERATESLIEAGADAGTIEVALGLANGHLMGTARMGDDPATSVVDRHGMAHEIPNLGIVDGSVFVTAGSANPTSTIAALALRTADHLIATRGRPTNPLLARFTTPEGRQLSQLGVDVRAPRVEVRAPDVEIPATPGVEIQAPAPMRSRAAPALAVAAAVEVAEVHRERFAEVADAMIPAAADRPAPSAVEVAGRRLDQVLAARPDLAATLARALDLPGDPGPGGARLLARLEASDPEAARALRTSVAGAYYLAPEVRTALGYDGQEAAPAPPFAYPEYMEEGLLDHLLVQP